MAEQHDPDTCLECKVRKALGFGDGLVLTTDVLDALAPIIGEALVPHSTYDIAIFLAKVMDARELFASRTSESSQHHQAGHA